MSHSTASVRMVLRFWSTRSRYPVMQFRSFTSVFAAVAILGAAWVPHRTLAQDYVFTTFAGIVGQDAETDGIGDNARFRFPSSLCIDSAGTLFVTDVMRGETDFRASVRRITPTGAVTTVYRHPEFVSWFNGIVVDGDGNLYVTHGHAVYR